MFDSFLVEAGTIYFAKGQQNHNMYKNPDIRFEATYADMAIAGYVIFPISIAVTQSTAAKALVDAQRVATDFC